MDRRLYPSLIQINPNQFPIDYRGHAHLPEQFGAWQSVYDRFRAWSKNGLWNAILQALSAAERDDEAVMIDSTAMRVYAHGANRAGGQEA